MASKKLENILLCVLLLVIGAVYLYTIAPTLSFWDCGEFIASAYTLAVPHPPGTPLYLLLGRVWLIAFGVISSLLPISKEVAWHMNLLGLTFSLLTIFVLYKLILRLFRMFKRSTDEFTLIIIAFATCLGIGFFYTFWQNAIETEVYAAATFVFVFVNYLAVLWYQSVKRGTANHKYLLLIFYVIFLSTGVHLTPFLIFVPVFIFIFIVERRYLKDSLLMLFGVFQLLLFTATFLLPKTLYTPALFIMGSILLLAIILPIHNPKKYRNWKFFWAGAFLVLMGISAELYLPIRATKITALHKDKKATERYIAGENIAPRINECDPGENFNIGAMFNFDSAYNYVLHRKQYGPQRFIPRQTQDATGFSLIQGSFWQFAHFMRYLSWQPMPEGNNRILRSIVLGLFYLFGIWGMVEMYKREKKIFLLMMLIMFMLSFAIVGYLNLKFSPSDSNPEHLPREVRERDYFFHTSHVYFGIFIGFGFLGFADLLKKQKMSNRLILIGGLGGILVFSTVPLFANIHLNNRHGNMIPKDYGYNLLASCDDGSILFTNGDNDTFPLWFVQEVLGVKRRVVIANLSLINTNWYIKQLKYWGVPISFSDYVIDRLEPFITQDRRIMYIKDIMIRNILAANIGKKLKNEDYVISQEEFAERYLKDYNGIKTVYFSSTVSPENYEGFTPYLKLEGLVYRLTSKDEDTRFSIDVEKTKRLFFNVYRYSSIFSSAQQPTLSKILPHFEKRKKAGEFNKPAVEMNVTTKRLFSNYIAGLSNLGLVLQQQDKIDDALNAWRFAALFPTDQSFSFDYNIGVLFASQGVLDSAELYFSKLEVKDPRLMTRIGVVYKAAGYHEGAVEYFQMAIRTNPRIPEAYFGLYSTYMGNNDISSARQVLHDWLQVNPQDTSALNMLRELRK
jgi:tetratricopeptide (TPR) repeat protein